MKKKKLIHLAAAVYIVLLGLFSTYAVLDAFVIPRTYERVQTESIMVTETAKNENTCKNTDSVDNSDTEEAGMEHDTDEVMPEETSAARIVQTEDSYSDGNISINIEKFREYDTDIYVADIAFSSVNDLRTAFASDIYGKNITEKTSVIAEDNDAVIAINGDYYGSRNSGYVIRNGELYREEKKDADQQDFVIYADGSAECICEGDVTAGELVARGAWQVFSFGPALVTDGEVAVQENDEVDKSKTSNPRTAIGYIDNGHYIFVVSDGRTDESEGLSLYELAQFMEKLGVVHGYNLDGGGSSTMVFCGNVVNNPTSGKGGIKERSVSDIVYIPKNGITED